MRLPWVTRSHHEEVVQLLEAHNARLDEERKKLLDRFASFGLGGPIYTPIEPKPAPATSNEVEKEEVEKDDAPPRRRLPRSPSVRSRFIEREKQQEFDAQTQRIMTRLDAAEDEARQQVS